MKFVPAPSESMPRNQTVRHYPVWQSENGWLLIMAKDDMIVLEKRSPVSEWLQMLPFVIYMKDPGIIGFVVYHIMDVLKDVSDAPDLDEAEEAIKAYLDGLCPEEDKGEQHLKLGSEYGGLQLLADLGAKRIYQVRRDHVRKYMKEQQGERCEV